MELQNPFITSEEYILEQLEGMRKESLDDSDETIYQVFEEWLGDNLIDMEMLIKRTSFEKFDEYEKEFRKCIKDGLIQN